MSESVAIRLFCLLVSVAMMAAFLIADQLLLAAISLVNLLLDCSLIHQGTRENVCPS